VISIISSEEINRLIADAGLHDQLATERLDEPSHRRELGIVPTLDARDVHLRHAERRREFLLADVLMLAQSGESILAQDFVRAFSDCRLPLRRPLMPNL
jgi:hypothetical protein